MATASFHAPAITAALRQIKTMAGKAIAQPAVAVLATLVAVAATPAQASGWKTCTWNGAPLACTVDHSASGDGWEITFKNGAHNVYWLPGQSVTVTNQRGLTNHEPVKAFMEEGKGLTAIDTNGGVLKAPFRF